MINLKTAFFIAFLIFSLSFSSYAQSKDSIYVVKKMATVFMKDGKYLQPKDLLALTKSNPDAYKEMKRAKLNYDFAFGLGYIGGGFIGFPIGYALTGTKKINWVPFLIGAGAFIGASIPFNRAYIRHTKNAVEIYNSSL
jgi:hypothetical protein